MEVVTSGSPPCKPCNSKQGLPRQLADYMPDVWGDYFITHPSLPSTHKESETWMKQRVSRLIDEVKGMMFRDAFDPMAEMVLIDALQRLGVDYHFEEEIDQVLLRIHDTPVDADDLHSTALRFRLLRQAQYDIPSDVFNRFRDDQGVFKTTLRGDLKGLLSLYEAAYLAKPGEVVLDEAISFARSCLESMSTDLEPPLAKRVLHALETPLHRRMRRLEARLYIPIYEEDEEERNDVVLELARLDFHLLQLFHIEEIRAISMWWKELDLLTKLTFARDRIVESYFWILGLYFEPHYSRARMMMTKVLAMVSLLDDIFDAYGTLDELQQYTDTIQRWNSEDADQLEECVKLHFLALTSTVKGFEDELAIEGLSYRTHYIREAIKEISRAYLDEAKWREEGCVPSLEDHLRVSLVSSGYNLLACASFLGMGEVATKEAFDWVISINPNIIKSTNVIGRLMNDVVSYELESKRDHIASTVVCYIKEHGGSNKEACEKLLDMAEVSWREVNQEFLNLTELPMPLLMRILNLARMNETMYRDMDRYTCSQALKDYITLLLVQPISF